MVLAQPAQIPEHRVRNSLHKRPHRTMLITQPYGADGPCATSTARRGIIGRAAFLSCAQRFGRFGGNFGFVCHVQTSKYVVGSSLVPISRRKIGTASFDWEIETAPARQRQTGTAWVVTGQGLVQSAKRPGLRVQVDCRRSVPASLVTCPLLTQGRPLAGFCHSGVHDSGKTGKRL